MKKDYESPEFEFHALRFGLVMSNEVVISDPQIPDDDYNPGDLE